MNTTCVCGGMNVHVCTCFFAPPGVTEVEEPNCYEREWSLSCNCMSVFDLSLRPYLCMSVCLRSINLQKCFNQEQHTTPIIFICSNSPPRNNIYIWPPILLSPSQNKWHEEIKPGRFAIFGQSLFILLCLMSTECEQICVRELNMPPQC